MIILGVDPGLCFTGFGVVDTSCHSMKTLGYGVIEVLKGQTIERRLADLFDSLVTVMLKYQPDQIAIEKVFINTNASSSLTLGQARGVLLAAIGKQKKEMFEYTALKIKKTVVGYGHADKKQVQYMVKDILKLASTPSTDAADALACAICHFYHQRFL